jgi:thiosulfate/3-mercaptopyruvate sulfurtransferase
MTSSNMPYTTLISADTLKPHIEDSGWKILDVRNDLLDRDAGLRAYQAGHIPGARFAHIDADLSGTKTGRNGRHPLPPRDVLAQRFRDWGIDNGTQIVAYDAHGGMYAARLWWLARWLGHSAVAVLDGGWPAWLAAGGAVATAEPPLTYGEFVATEARVRVAASQDVLDALGDTGRPLVDARLPERYRGEQEPLDPVAGHIPGALNRPWTQNLTSEQRFKPPAELRAEFTTLLGTRPPNHVTHQCGSGVTACHHVLAMEVAGLPGSALYAGSWSEWIADKSRPVRTGAEP